MKKVVVLLAVVLACTFSSLASAVPIRATFNGVVSGASGFNTNVLNDFPVGTAASFDVTFDDSGLVDSVPVTDYDLGPVSGWLRLGSLEWLFNAGQIYTYTYYVIPGDVVSYGLQLTGTGPTIGNNASLFGLFLRLTPDPEFLPGAVQAAGFGYPIQNGTYYSYAHLSGTFGITTVPEPASGMVMCGALALLAFMYRRRVFAATKVSQRF